MTTSTKCQSCPALRDGPEADTWTCPRCSRAGRSAEDESTAVPEEIASAEPILVGPSEAGDNLAPGHAARARLARMTHPQRVTLNGWCGGLWGYRRLETMAPSQLIEIFAEFDEGRPAARRKVSDGRR